MYIKKTHLGDASEEMKGSWKSNKGEWLMDKFSLNIFTPIPAQIYSMIWHSLSHMSICISHTQIWPTVTEEKKYYYRQ